MIRNVHLHRIGGLTVVLLVTSAIVAIASPPAMGLVGADVSIQVSASPNPVEVGQQLTLTLTVRNDGTANADDVTVIDALVASLDFQAAIPSVGSCSGTTTVVCSLGTMTPGQAATITMHATPNAPGQVVNTATVVALLDTDLTDNTAVTVIQVDPAGGGGGGGGGGGVVADLVVTMGVAPDPGAVGAQLTYAITVSNAGPDAAEGVTLVDTLPAFVTPGPVSASQGSCTGTMVVTCALGTLQDGSVASITIGVVPTAEGVVTNSALVASSTLDPDPLDNQAIRATTIQAAGVGTADVTLAMDVSPDPGAVGAPLTYDITVTNAGPDQAANVTLVDALPPAGITLDSVNPSQGSCSGTAPVTCDLGALESGSSATVRIDVVPTVEGQLANSALAASSTLDPNPLNNQVMTSTTVAGRGGCTITGTDGGDRLRGTAGRDVICGLGGADRLVGLRGNDVLKGGGGDDLLRGGASNDRLVGGPGGDVMKGSGGRDVLKGGPGRDRYSGGRDRDRCTIREKERARGCE